MILKQLLDHSKDFLKHTIQNAAYEKLFKLDKSYKVLFM